MGPKSSVDVGAVCVVGAEVAAVEEEEEEEEEEGVGEGVTVRVEVPPLETGWMDVVGRMADCGRARALAVVGLV